MKSGLKVRVKKVWEFADRGALLPNETIVLKREPDNEVDEFAVRVFRVHADTNRHEHVGYVDKENAEAVCKVLDSFSDSVVVNVIPPLNPVQALLHVEWLDTSK